MNIYLLKQWKMKMMKKLIKTEKNRFNTTFENEKNRKKFHDN